METVIAFIVIFGALVFFHELGHLVFAKRAGILCREFAIGFGPKVLAFKKNETLYTIRLLPLGGYVRMAGEDPEVVDLKPGHRIGIVENNDGLVTKIILSGRDKFPNSRAIEVEDADLEHQLFIKGYEEGEENVQRFSLAEDALIIDGPTKTQIAPWNRQFASKSLGHRAITIFAGPLMNFVLAFFIFVIIGILQGVPSDAPKLGTVEPSGAAAEAGLVEGDEIVAIDGERTPTWEEIVTKVRQHPGDELQFTVNRDGETLQFAVTPETVEIETEEESYGRIGVYNPVEKSAFKSITYGLEETKNWTVQIVRMLGLLVTGQFSIDMLSGPVGIYKSTEIVAASGIYQLMRWAAILSINLGIMNLLPIPALDGGRLLFFAVEAVRGKPIDRHKEGLVHFVGFALLMLLMLIVTWNDIQHFFLQ